MHKCVYAQRHTVLQVCAQDELGLHEQSVLPGLTHSDLNLKFQVEFYMKQNRETTLHLVTKVTAL